MYGNALKVRDRAETLSMPGFSVSSQQLFLMHCGNNTHDAEYAEESYWPIAHSPTSQSLNESSVQDEFYYVIIILIQQEPRYSWDHMERVINTALFSKYIIACSH